MTHTESQNEQILSYLKTNSGLSPIKALKKFGCMRLGARIHDLRSDGHSIITVMASHGGKRFAYYILKDKHIVSNEA